MDGNRAHRSRRSFGRGNHGIPAGKGEKCSQLRSEMRKALRGEKSPLEHFGEQDTGRERMDGQREGEGFRAMKKKSFRGARKSALFLKANKQTHVQPS